jgi:peptidoglycan/xylan/chitin deacetylase (PgdA/CDA1 family)
LRDEHEWQGGLYITPDRFRQALQWLREWNANVLPLAEGLDAAARQDSLPPRSVVITFDDGFYDFYRHAWPLLVRVRLSEHALSDDSLHPLPPAHLQPGGQLPLVERRGRGGDPRARPARPKLQRYLERAARENLDTEGRDVVARHLAESLGINYDGILQDRVFQIMTADEVATVARGGVDIQLHTHRHRTPAEPRAVHSRNSSITPAPSQEMTGRTPSHFCYPSGVTSPEFLPWLRECAVESATTCVPGLARAATDPLLLPRYLDGGGVDRLDFESWLSGLR